jgi:quercetin dioxygenase-like cupin family protein
VASILAVAWFASGAAVSGPMDIVKPASTLQTCGKDAPPGCQHVLLHGDPSVGASQHIHHFLAGSVFVKPWHASSQELVRTKGTLTTAADGQAEMKFTVGDDLHIPAKVVHWGACLTECEFYLMVDGLDSFSVVERN